MYTIKYMADTFHIKLEINKHVQIKHKSVTYRWLIVQDCSTSIKHTGDTAVLHVSMVTIEMI